MFKIKFTEETSFEIIVILMIIGTPLLMFLLNYLLGGPQKAVVDKEKEKTVIVTQAKQSDPLQKPPPESVVNSVREAIKKGNYSTAYMEINNVSKTSPEYAELSKQLSEESQSRKKTPGVRKEAGTTPSDPIRYLDESTPRNRATDAIYIYFVDISGLLTPRFCIQTVTKNVLDVTGFTITADSKKFEIIAAPIKSEITTKGVAEWYDVPLDRRGYEAVSAMIKAKKVSLTVVGKGGTKTRDLPEKEKKGFSNILAGYEALGGNPNYFQIGKPVSSPPKKKRP